MEIALKNQFLISILAIKYQISESYHKNLTLLESFKVLCPLAIKWWPFHFLAESVWNLFHWLILFNFTNIRYLHLLMCLLHAKDKQAVEKFRIWNVLMVKWRSFQFSTKLVVLLKKNIWFLHLKEKFPVIFSKTLVVQN